VTVYRVYEAQGHTTPAYLGNQVPSHIAHHIVSVSTAWAYMLQL